MNHTDINTYVGYTNRDWREPLDHNRPMAAARMVRRDRYAWPGGYAMMLLTVDGGALCPDCTRANWHEICSANYSADDSGWHPAGIISECETDGTVTCDHCNVDTINPQEQ